MGRRRFESATERRLNAITKKATEMIERAEKEAAPVSAGGSEASGSELTAAARAAGVVDQKSEIWKKESDNKKEQRARQTMS